jgi:hypothetical protein
MPAGSGSRWRKTSVFTDLDQFLHSGADSNRESDSYCQSIFPKELLLVPGARLLSIQSPELLGRS